MYISREIIYHIWSFFFPLQNSFHLTILIQYIFLHHGVGHRHSPEMIQGSFTYNLEGKRHIYDKLQ